MKIDYEPTERLRWKYPWRQMNAIGDYFDIPPGSPKQANGVRNAAWQQTQYTGVVFQTKTLASGVVRVMVIDIEYGAQL